MNLKPATIITTFAWCIFMGIVAISIGFGAIFPSINRITKPFVCPNGEMELETQVYRPSPVETVTTIMWYCVDSQTGERTALGIFPMSLYAGTIYGLPLFVGVLSFMYVSAKRQASTSALGSFKLYKGDPSERAAHIKERLAELNKLHDAKVISETEYRKKRTEILEDV